MTAISLLEKLGVDPSASIDDLSSQEIADVDALTKSLRIENTTMIVIEPSDPDEPNREPEEEPVPESVA